MSSLAKKAQDINPAKPDNRSNHYLTDFFNNYDEVTNKITVVDDLMSKNNITNSLINYFNFRSWLFYILNATFIAIICYLVELCAFNILSRIKQLLFIIKNYFKERINTINSLNYFPGLFIWLVSAFLLATMSTAICHALGQEAQGAGVAEIKCILSAARMSEYLKGQILIAKFLSLITALGGGFTVGKVGPCLHLGGLVSFNLSKLRIFKQIKTDSVLKMQSLMIGSAVGLACAFGTPLAGLIAGIELVGKINTVRTIWILYVSLFISMLVLNILSLSGLTPTINQFNHELSPLSSEIIAFAFLGIFCGLISAFFINSCMSYQVFRYDKETFPIFRTRYCYTWAAILITAFFQFNFTILQLGDKRLLNDFFSDKELGKDWIISDKAPLIINLLGLLILKFVIIFLGITSPIAGGVFGPFLIIGSIAGRFFGTVFQELFEIKNVGRYAMAGAAALSATSTKFLAMTLVIIETTGDLNIAIPIMITVMFSFGTGNLFAKSFFYSTIELRKLPYVPKLMRAEIYNLEVRDIMQKPKIYLHAHTTFFEVFEFLARGKNICLADYIPVTLDLNDMTFVGTVKTENLKNYFLKQIKLHKRRKKSMWILQMKIMLRMYNNLDEEAIVDGKEMCKQAKSALEIYKKMESKKNISLLETESNKVDFSFLRQKLEEIEDDDDNEEKALFFSRIVDFADCSLKFDRSPVCVNLWTYLSKIHFLFITLGVSTLFVVDRGVLKGVIKRNYFLGLNNEKDYRN